MTGMHAERPLYESRDEIDHNSPKPNFMCPIYRAYLGTNYQDKQAELGSLVKVSKDTPPTFLSVTADDAMRAAQAALLFVQLKNAGVSAELHIYRGGGHGYGIRGEFPAARWNLALHDWLRGEKFLTK